MSTVIWYKGDMYADTQGTCESVIVDKVRVAVETTKMTKIFKEDGKLYGITGEIGGWFVFQNRRKKNGFYWGFTKAPESTIIEYDGENLIWWRFRQKRILGIYISRFVKGNMNGLDWIISGSGFDWALEALDRGLGPEEAIKYASKHDSFTNDEVIKVSL